VEIKKIKQNTAIICLSSNSGGMEIDAIKLAQKLSNYTYITLIAKENQFIANSKEEYLNNDIQLETINFKSNLGISIILNAKRIIKKYHIKNIIFFGASELKSLYFSFLGLDINLIVRHGTTKSRPKKDWFHKLIYSNVNYHVSICKHLQHNVEYIIPFGEKTESKLIYSSFNFNPPQSQQNKKLTILHIGRIAQGKGQIDAIKACDILVQNGIDFEFNIVGGFEKSYKDDFLTFYNLCSYRDKINLIGYTKDIEFYLNRADIFLFPSHGEGLSNAFMEALSYNLVTLSYNNTSFPELKDLGLYFKMIQHLDIDQLKNSLLYVTQNLLKEKEYSSRNSTLIKRLFSLEKEMSNYLKILE